MKNTIHHKWNKHIGFKSCKCERYGVIRKYDPGFVKPIFTFYGRPIHLFDPGCVMPNTKL